VLPSIKVLEKILCYETKLERQLYRAMAARIGTEALAYSLLVED